MPLQYAIKEVIPEDGVSLEDADKWNSTTVFHSVSEDVATTNEEYGFFCLVNNLGDEVSVWIPLNNWTKRTLESLPTVKSKGGPHKDIMGEELAIGDFVALTGVETADLVVGKVVAFTDKKVRILVYRWWFEVVLKNPSGLIKIQPQILSE